MREKVVPLHSWWQLHSLLHCMMLFRIRTCTLHVSVSREVKWTVRYLRQLEDGFFAAIAHGQSLTSSQQQLIGVLLCNGAP